MRQGAGKELAGAVPGEGIVRGGVEELVVGRGGLGEEFRSVAESIFAPIGIEDGTLKGSDEEWAEVGWGYRLFDRQEEKALPEDEVKVLYGIFRGGEGNAVVILCLAENAEGEAPILVEEILVKGECGRECGRLPSRFHFLVALHLLGLKEKSGAARRGDRT